MFGQEGNNSLSGGRDADFILGEAGDDILFGGRGNDALDGGEGDNTLVGGLGRDFLSCGFGNNLCVLGIEPATTDINSSDIIEGFDPDLDRIGLARDLRVNDIVLEPVQNVALTYTFDGAQALQPLLPPGPLGAFSGPGGSSTQKRNYGSLFRNSNQSQEF